MSPIGGPGHHPGRHHALSRPRAARRTARSAPAPPAARPRPSRSRRRPRPPRRPCPPTPATSPSRAARHRPSLTSLTSSVIRRSDRPAISPGSDRVRRPWDLERGAGQVLSPSGHFLGWTAAHWSGALVGCPPRRFTRRLASPGGPRRGSGSGCGFTLPPFALLPGNGTGSPPDRVPG